MRAELEAKGVPPPDDDELNRLSKMYNERLEQKRKNELQEKSHSWYNLFKVYILRSVSDRERRRRWRYATRAQDQSRVLVGGRRSMRMTAVS